MLTTIARLLPPNTVCPGHRIDSLMTLRARFGTGDEYLIAARLRDYKLYHPSSIMGMASLPPRAHVPLGPVVE